MGVFGAIVLIVLVVCLTAVGIMLIAAAHRSEPASLMIANGSNPTDLVYVFRDKLGGLEVLIRREAKWHKVQPGFMLIEADQKKFDQKLFEASVVHDGRYNK